MKDKKCILIIDDDPAVPSSMKVILEENDFATAIALSGDEGIEAFEKIRPDLVLCDMMMETIDSGIKTAMEIRNSGSKVPIFLLSSIGNMTASNIELDKFGFNGVFQKPV